jgi:class 3 adenylate cyclase
MILGPQSDPGLFRPDREHRCARAKPQNLAGSDEICLTEDVRKATGVEDALASYAVRSAEAELRGVDRPTRIYFVAAAPPHEAA